MKLIHSLYLLGFSTITGFSQISFQEALLPPPAPQMFDAFSGSSVAFADIDGDNDQDVLLVGENTNGYQFFHSKLYKNDGNGVFTEIKGTSFGGYSNPSIAFADVDGDKDQDVLITGKKGWYNYSADLYINDGSGNFTKASDTPFEGVEYSSIAFADIDGDKDQDILITGKTKSNDYIAKLYKNDSLGNFVEMLATPFEGVWASSVAFADIDGDKDKDLLITGSTASSSKSTSLYKNDGSGNFFKINNQPFDKVNHSSVAFEDIDNDNDLDLLITGQNLSRQNIAKLYRNDGTGDFSEIYNTALEGVSSSSVAFADIDGDNDNDLLITGKKTIPNP